MQDFPEPRQVNGVTIIGPDLFSRNEKGVAESPIASVLPWKSLLVTGRGIHAMQIAMMISFLKGEAAHTEGVSFSRQDEDFVYHNAVALLVRDDVVLIRSDPKKMDSIFAADELLQNLVPKKQIQFTGIHSSIVRDQLRAHGQCWRISSMPRSVADICQSIESSHLHVGTGAMYYHNMQTGGRFLTCEEFRRIGLLLDVNVEEALARLKEIRHLTNRVNDQAVREVSFFLPQGKTLDPFKLSGIIDCIEGRINSADLEMARQYYNRFARKFAQTAGEDLAVDDINNVSWRTTMFCRLCDIDEKSVEERSLGLSPEFFLNVRWLPGARIVSKQLLYEENVEPKVRNIVTYYWRKWRNLVSINVGKVETSLAHCRARTAERRSVYLVVLGLASGREEVRVVRMAKWDVVHRINRGMSLSRAIQETEEYRQYIEDRIRAVRKLQVPIPDFSQIKLLEDCKGLGRVPVYMFERQYVLGMVTDKIPVFYYEQDQFIERLAGFLGQAAGVSLVLGRVSPATGHVFFDDGDEIIQFDENRLPIRLMVSETTGSFTDWQTPLRDMVSHCVHHLINHLEKAQERGIPRVQLVKAVRAFCDGVVDEVNRIKALVKQDPGEYWNLFADYPQEVGGIASRWQGVLKRIEMTDPDVLRERIMRNAELGEMFKGPDFLR